MTHTQIGRRKYLRTLLWLAQGTLVAASAWGQAAPARLPITSEQVLGAMKADQLPVDGAEVILSAPITTLSAAPALVIRGIVQLAPFSIRMRVACQDPTQCLPFYVSASWPKASSPLVLPAHLLASASQHHAASPQSIGKDNASSVPSFNSRVSKPLTEAAVKAGSSAFLMFEDQKIHIRLKVVCLEGGAEGATIRVATLDRKQAYKAEIVAPNLLRGSF